MLVSISFVVRFGHIRDSRCPTLRGLQWCAGIKKTEIYSPVSVSLLAQGHALAGWRARSAIFIASESLFPIKSDRKYTPQRGGGGLSFFGLEETGK